MKAKYQVRSWPADRPLLNRRAARIVSYHDDIAEARAKRDAMHAKPYGKNCYFITDWDGNTCDYFPAG
jgi:hypothetical protein